VFVTAQSLRKVFAHQFLNALVQLQVHDEACAAGKVNRILANKMWDHFRVQMSRERVLFEVRLVHHRPQLPARSSQLSGGFRLIKFLGRDKSQSVAGLVKSVCLAKEEVLS
jgi:hypothetical protein